jgi:excinuclease ABC subunit A
MDHIRKLFTLLPESRIRGYKPGRFSFNVVGGRCEDCKGAGVRTVEMNFLPNVHVPCDTCLGRRFNRETLEVRYKGRSISDVLDMTVREAAEFFDAYPKIKRIVTTLKDVGLGYITLGQPSTTLSGGEAQRVKLASELARVGTGNTLYILDEPTTGLHFSDVQMLLNVLNRLVNQGNTVLVIEHNLDVIKVADHVIDLGPEGGNGGGNIIASGTPEHVACEKNSYTGNYLSKILH